MQDRILKMLEFHKVKEQLLTYVSSSLGKKKAEDLVPSTDFSEVIKLQNETDEAAQVLRMRGSVPLGGFLTLLLT